MSTPKKLEDFTPGEVVEKLSQVGKEVLAEGFPPRRVIEDEEKAAYNQGFLDALALAIYYINQLD